METHWSTAAGPCCGHCERSPEEIPGAVTPDKLKAHGWMHSGFGWYCPDCEAVGREEAERGWYEGETQE